MKLTENKSRNPLGMQCVDKHLFNDSAKYICCSIYTNYTKNILLRSVALICLLQLHLRHVRHVPHMYNLTMAET